MKSIQGQRIYLGTTDADFVLDHLDVYAQTDHGEEADILGGTPQPCLMAGETRLALVFDENWARELCELLEKFHKREQGYIDELARLFDENAALKMEKDQAKVQACINERLRV